LESSYSIFATSTTSAGGTREAEPKKNLGSTKIGTGNEDNVDAEISSQDLDALCHAELQKFNTSAPEEAEPVLSVKDKNGFYDASFRSYVVLAWMFCNAALVAIILRPGGIQRTFRSATDSGWCCKFGCQGLLDSGVVDCGGFVVFQICRCDVVFDQEACECYLRKIRMITYLHTHI
jgi:hypothetical protein